MTAGQAGNGVQPGDLQRLLRFQRRQQGWQLMRQSVFCRTRWPHQQQVMSARGGDGESLSCEAAAGSFAMEGWQKCWVRWCSDAVGLLGAGLMA